MDPLRWGLIYGHRQRSGHAYLAKQAPPRWGFLGLWRVVVDGLPNVTRKHLPTSVGVSPLGKPYLLSLGHASQTPPHLGGGYSCAYLSIVNEGFAIPTFVGVFPARTYPIPHPCGSFRPGLAGVCAC